MAQADTAFPSAAPAAEAGDVAVIIVHGVGDNEPGSTVNYVVKSLCDQQTDQFGRAVTHDELMNADRQNEVYTFREPRTSWQAAVKQARLQLAPEQTGSSADNFTVYGRQATLPDGTRAGFYELHWADLARSGSSWWEAIKGFARFVFEIPHVVDGFLRGTPGFMSWLLRRFLLLATCFVRGPIAGYAFVMLAGGLIYTAFSWIPDREEVMAIIGLKQERSGGVVSMFPDWARVPAIAWLEHLRTYNTPRAMMSVLAVIMLTAGAVAIRFRRTLPIAYLSWFICFAAAFYLVDIGILRPDRYKRYSGFVYVDYLSVMLLATSLFGVYFFQTRRATEVGFADLGLFIALWSAFLIVHLSVLGDWGREYAHSLGLIAKPVLITSTVATNSSLIHFQAFSMFYPYLGWLWAIWALLMTAAFVLAFAVFIIHWRRWADYHRGIFAALALAIVQATVWLTVLPAVGIMHMDDVLCRGSLNYSTVKQPVSCQTKLDRNREVVDLLYRVKLQDPAVIERMPSSLVSELDDTVRRRFRSTLDFDMLKAMREMAMSFIWHGFILVFASAIAVVVAIWRHVRARRSRMAAGALRLPRMIINGWVLAALLVFGLVNTVLCFVWVEGFGVFYPAMQALGISSVSQFDVPAEAVQMAIMATTAFLIIGQIPAIATPLSGVLQIMQGLIDHHYRPRVSIARRMMMRKNDEPIRRDHIAARLEVLVDELVRKPGYKRVLFLSHSQGSVIVYDYLKYNAGRIDAPIHVLTAGSPLGALYAYYFNEYGDVEDELPKLGPRVLSWTNLYRSDDPIAGPILAGGPNTAAGRNRLAFHDIEMKPGGHLRYWQEPLVCDTIRNLLAGRDPIPPQGAAPPRSPGTPRRPWRRSKAAAPA